MAVKTITPATATVPFIFRFALPSSRPWQRSMAPGSSETFMYTTVGGSWIYFAFIEAVVMRLFDDVRLWRYLCAGILINDAVYCHAIAQAVGGWNVWLNVTDWTTDDHMVFWSTWPLIIIGFLVVLGVGFKKVPGQKKHD